MLRKGFQEMTTYIKNTKKFQGAGKLLLSQSPLKLGDHCQAQFCRSLASGNSLEQTAQLKARLLCAEIVTYRVGTDDTTVRQIVFEQPLETQSVPTGTQTIEYTATLKIPSNATPSFEAKHNRILWQVEVKVEFDPVILQQKNTNKDPWVEDGTLSTFAFSVDPEVV
ncbi:MAG: hypothetical protein HC920_17260 [Oscillatoriales cyanobacterium SM2_3_0]|nr:hypothetical protein [Oscillatoriales cyanobacterium SM2_3_0]